MIVKYIFESGDAAGVRALDRQVLPARLSASTFYHFVGNRTCEKYHKVGRSDFIFQSVAHLREDFSSASVILAYIYVLSDHPVVTAYDNYAHVNLLAFV